MPDLSSVVVVQSTIHGAVPVLFNEQSPGML